MPFSLPWEKSWISGHTVLGLLSPNVPLNITEPGDVTDSIEIGNFGGRPRPRGAVLIVKGKFGRDTGCIAELELVTTFSGAFTTDLNLCGPFTVSFCFLKCFFKFNLNIKEKKQG